MSNEILSIVLLGDILSATHVLFTKKVSFFLGVYIIPKEHKIYFLKLLNMA